MREQRIIDGAVFGPEVLKLVEQAFDEAWAAIEDKFDVSEVFAAREHLSRSIILSLREDSNEVADLREAGIRSMRLRYPSLWRITEQGPAQEATRQPTKTQRR